MTKVGTSIRLKSFRKSVEENAVRAVLANVAGHLTAAHGEADEGEVTKVELRHELVQILGKRVVVVAGRRPAGLPEPSAVVGDDPVTRVQQVRRLLLPGSAAQRPPVDQNDGLARAVVFVVDIDRCRVFLADRDGTHLSPPPVPRPFSPVYNIWPRKSKLSSGIRGGRSIPRGGFGRIARGPEAVVVSSKGTRT